MLQLFRRGMAVLITATGAIIAAGVGAIQEHPVIMWGGIIAGGLLVVAVVLWLIKKSGHAIFTTLTSSLFLFVAAVVCGFLAYHSVINSLAGYIAGFVIAGGLTFLLYRRIGKSAQRSMVWGELFTFLTGYEVRAVIHRNTVVDKEERQNEKAEFNNIVVVLKDNYQLKAKEAKEAATYALNNAGDAPLEEKIRLAFQYHGNARN